MSHNEYSDNNKFTSKELPNYLILIETQGQPYEIIFENSITKTIKTCADIKQMCKVFEKNGTRGKNWKYMCDISKGVI